MPISRPSRIASPVLTVMAVALYAASTPAMEDGTTGIGMAPKLAGIEAVAPDHHRILADGTFDTYSIDEKWRFAMELQNILTPGKPPIEMRERRTGDRLSDEMRKRIEDRESRSVMFFIRTMDVLLRTTAGTLELARSDIIPTKLEAATEIMALMKGQDELDKLRDEYMNDRRRTDEKRPDESQAGKEAGAPDDDADVTQIIDVVICQRRMVRCTDDVVDEFTEALAAAVLVKEAKDLLAKDRLDDCLEEAGGAPGVERRCNYIYFNETDANDTEFQDTVFEAAKEFQRGLAACIAKFLICMLLAPLPGPMPPLPPIPTG